MNNNIENSSIENRKRKKTIIIILLVALMIIVFGIGTFVGTLLNNKNEQIKEEETEEVITVKVPVASHKLSTRTKIKDDDLDFIDLPKDTLSEDYYQDISDIIGKYVDVNTSIPKGSFFYKDSIVNVKELPDAALIEVPEGEALYYLNVNMLNSYTNSILPGRYIDIYISTKANNKALVGKLIENVRVLQVKTADGENVFDENDSNKVPYVIIFSLPEEEHLLLRKINAINNYSIPHDGLTFSRIEVTPVPKGEIYKDGDQEIKPNISSNYLKDYILNLSNNIPN